MMKYFHLEFVWGDRHRLHDYLYSEVYHIVFTNLKSLNEFMNRDDVIPMNSWGAMRA